MEMFLKWPSVIEKSGNKNDCKLEEKHLDRIRKFMDHASAAVKKKRILFC
jgi:hypothetical protein